MTVKAIAYSADGKLIAIANDSRSVILHEGMGNLPIVEGRIGGNY